MTPLEAQLRRTIAFDGPIPLNRYMAEVLAHPRHGYYSDRDPLGAAGDFITAPEISQMFGELIGLWAAQLWLGAGRPKPLRLVELGPGRGTLMADALRAARIAQGFLDAASIHLIESGRVLREIQRDSLQGHAVSWHDRLEDVPAGPAIVIANEFFDALPVRQFQRAGDRWHERMVGLRDNALAFVLSPEPVAPALLPPWSESAPEGSVIELSPTREQAMAGLAERIAGDGLAALVIDYGYDVSQPGETLQALRRHKPVPVLEQPGDADLTVHVDFAALARAAVSAGARAHGPVGQGDWLRRLGIEARAAALAAKATPRQRETIASALHRLTHPDEMGRLFRVLAVAAADAPPPPGFEEGA